MFTGLSRRARRLPQVVSGGPTVRPRVAVLACAVAVGLAGCGSSTPGASSSPDATAAGDVTIDNCGTTLTLSAPPSRVVTIKSSPLELLLALGQRDRVVGTAFSDGPVPEALAAQSQGLTVLSEKVPSQEVVLAAEPDLVFGGWESNFTAEGAGDRQALAALGVSTYVAPAACKSPGYMPDPLTFDTVFSGFEEAGRVFGAQQQAAQLVSDQKAALEAITPDSRGLTAAWYSSGTKTPYMGAGIGAPQMIMEAAGLKNIASDVRDTWTSMGWESVVAAEPDVIVLVDAQWNTAEAKKKLLESNPVTAALPAVRERRYVTVDFPATEAGVRNVEAVASITRQLADIDADAAQP